MSADVFALLCARSHTPSPRRLARIVADVSQRSTRPAPPPNMLRPCDVDGWERTLRAALRLAPDLPARAWRTALLAAWPREDNETGAMAHAFAAKPEALLHLAAVVALHGTRAERLAPKALRRAVAIVTAAGVRTPPSTAMALRGRVARWQTARHALPAVQPQGDEAREAL